MLASEISAKRAMNLWIDLVVAPFSRAFTDDDPRYSNVCVGPASANPTTGVKSPVTKDQLDEDRRERQPMYPHELARRLACDAIAIAARRIYVLATYLYLRPQELYAFRWTDVAWMAREVRIRRKVDVHRGEGKAGTRSDAGVREVPIHEHLMPLLEAMHGPAASDDEQIVPLIGAARLFGRFADQTPRHVKLAGIDRAELVDGSEDLMPFDFRSWRTTGCTWLAMRSPRPLEACRNLSSLNRRMQSRTSGGVAGDPRGKSLGPYADSGSWGALRRASDGGLRARGSSGC